MTIFDYMSQHPIMTIIIVLIICETLTNFAKAWASKKFR